MAGKREAIEAQYPGREIVSRGPVQVRPDPYDPETMVTVPWINLGTEPDPDDLIEAVALRVGSTWAWIRHDDLQPVSDSDRELLQTEAKPEPAGKPTDDEVWACGMCEEHIEVGDVDSPLYGCNDCGNSYTRDGSMDGSSNRCPDCNKFGSKLSDYGCPECGEGELMPQ